MSSTKLRGAALLLSIGVSLAGCAGRVRPTHAGARANTLEGPAVHCESLGLVWSGMTQAEQRAAGTENVLARLRDRAAERGATDIVAAQETNGVTTAYRCDHGAEERGWGAEERDAILAAHPAWIGASRTELERQNGELSAQTAAFATVTAVGAAGVLSGLGVVFAHMGTVRLGPCIYGCDPGTPGNSETMEIGGAIAGASGATFLLGLIWLLVNESTARPLRRLLWVAEGPSLDADVGPDRAALRLTGSF